MGRPSAGFTRTLPALLSLSLLAGLAAAQPAAPLSAASPAATPDAASIVDRFASAYAAIDDYQCRLYEWCVRGRSREQRTINFSFLRPRFIRMDIVKGNKALDAGSVGISRGGSTVTGRKGGIAAGIVLTVDRHSPLATTLRGATFDESDLEGILQKMRWHLANSTIRVEATRSTYRLFIAPRDPALNGGVTRDLMVFDAASFLPVYSESHVGETQVQQARWTSYILNAGIPSSFFEIRTAGSALRKAGLRSVEAVPVDEGIFDEKL